LGLRITFRFDQFKYLIWFRAFFGQKLIFKIEIIFKMNFFICIFLFYINGLKYLFYKLLLFSKVDPGRIAPITVNNYDQSPLDARMT